MKENSIFLPNEEFDKVNKETGELSHMRRVAKMKTLDDFFMICIATWDDFNEFEGMQSKIFRQCMKVSCISSANSDEGNFFFAGDAIEQIQKEFPEISANAARQHLYRLCKLGFIVQTGKRGRYSINPKYGFKGMITEDTYGELVVKGGNMRAAYENEKKAKDLMAVYPHNAGKDTEN